MDVRKLKRMVALSDTDSNKYRTILRFKESLPLREESLSSRESISLATSKINKYGEIEVQCLHQAQKRLTEEEIQELIAEYKNGKSIYALAQRLGCCKHTVRNALKKHGVNVTNRKAQRKLNVADVISMYENMHTSKEISEKYDVCPDAILQCLREQRVAIRGRWDYKPR